MVMDWAFPEKLARYQTGRPAVSTRSVGGGRLVVYPVNLRYRDLLPANEEDRSTETYFLEFAAGAGSILSVGAGYLRYIFNLFKILPLCSWIDLHLISSREKRLYILITVIAARLVGIAINLHDYRFKSIPDGKLSKLIFPLCRRLEMGDISAVSEAVESHPGLVFRNELFDPESYQQYTKERAIPRLIVYGDFEEPRVLSLVRRTHELVKQKYPRTEFILASFMATDKNAILSGVSGRSLSTALIKSSASLMKLFEGADSVMLLSPGGLNRGFRLRARAAGYPVIVNGFDCPGDSPDIIKVTRDSYSGLADAVIRLVDDDDYYRSFSSR